MVDADLIRALRGAAVEVVGRATRDDALVVRGQREQLIYTRRRKVKRIQQRWRARLGLRRPTRRGRTPGTKRVRPPESV